MDICPCIYSSWPNQEPPFLRKYVLATVRPKSMAKTVSPKSKGFNKVLEKLSALRTQAYVGVWAREECIYCKPSNPAQINREKKDRACKPSNFSNSRQRIIKRTSYSNVHDCSLMGHVKATKMFSFVTEFTSEVLSLARGLEGESTVRLHFFQGFDAAQEHAIKNVRKERAKLVLVRNTEDAIFQSNSYHNVLDKLHCSS